MNSFTPIENVDHKIDIMDHVNQDHSEEVLAIARSHSQQDEFPAAKIVDIFEEGVKITYQDEASSERELFVPFAIEGSLEDKILYLAYAAIVKQGRDFSGTGKRFFEVIDKQQITTNMVRLTIQAATPLPEYYPGHAYAFLLKTMQKGRGQDTVNRTEKHWAKNIFDRFFIWLMKHLSSKNRTKLLRNMNKDVRLYTLRKSWQSTDDADFINQGYVDVFTHGNTAGSQWVNELAIGDVVLSRSEAKDKHPHLLTGQAVLIADETAYPAAAGILEKWQNPEPPHVILLSTAQDEQDYFSDDIFPQGTQVHRVVCSAEQQGDEVIRVLETLEKIEVVWGALEADSAKAVRRYLRNSRDVMGRNNHTKGYWMLNSKRGE